MSTENHDVSEEVEEVAAEEIDSDDAGHDADADEEAESDEDDAEDEDED
jgi:hypothetical protein